MARKRKSAHPTSSPSAGSSVSKKAKTKVVVQIDHLFDTYANSSSGMIEPEGILTLCEDVGVNVTDVRILVFAWKLKAKKQGYFSLDEWQTGLKELGVGTFDKLKKVIHELGNEKKKMDASSNFEDFYSYAFEYNLTEERQKHLDIESVCDLLNLVFGAKFGLQADLLIQYLKVQNDYKAINFDQWRNFLRFFKEISFPDLNNYDTNDAWPLILDNFVEWMRKKDS